METECLRDRQVDDKLELVRRLHRQVGGVAALENAIHIGRGAAVLVVEIDPVGCKSPLGDEEAEWVDRRQSVARGSSDNRGGTVLDGDRLRCREKTAVRLGSKCGRCQPECRRRRARE